MSREVSSMLDGVLLSDLTKIIGEYIRFAGVEVDVLKGHTGGVESLSVLPDGHLASGSRDKTIRIWDLVTGTNQVLEGHTSLVLCLAVLPDGRLASGSYDETIRIWDLNRGKVSICEPLEEWDLTAVTSQILKGHKKWITSLAVLPDGRLVSGSIDNTIRIWDLNMDEAHICDPNEEGYLSTRTSQVLEDHVGPGPVNSLAVLPDGRLACGSADKTIRVWDLATRTSQILEGHTGCVLCFAVLPDGRLVSGSDDKTIRVWDLNIGKAHICEFREEGNFATRASQVLEGHTDWVTCLAVLPDGRLVSGSDDKTIRVWDLVTGTSQILKGHTDPVRSLSVLPDGRLASGSIDNTIRIWV